MTRMLSPCSMIADDFMVLGMVVEHNEYVRWPCLFSWSCWTKNISLTVFGLNVLLQFSVS